MKTVYLDYHHIYNRTHAMKKYLLLVSAVLTILCGLVNSSTFPVKN